MFVVFKNKVVISALHRLHLLKYFDHICVLENGEIIAEGNLESLLNSSATFRELWQHQETGKH